MIDTRTTNHASTRATGHRAMRALLLLLTAAALTYVLGVVVFGVVALVTQLTNGVIQPTMYWTSEYSRFTVDSNPGGTVQMAGEGGSTIITATGASASTVVLYVASVITGMLAQLALGVLALRIFTRLRTGAPFQRAAWREAATISCAVLVLGIAGQLLSWWTRVALLSDTNGVTSFTTAFVPEPLTLALGFALALVAVAFHFGEKLQADTAGLV